MCITCRNSFVLYGYSLHKQPSIDYLQYAISNGQAAVCKLLLSEKADPLIEDGANSQSALEWAWCKILGKSFEPDCLQEFETIFSDRECLEEFGFSEIHKLVLDLKSGNLKSLLESVDAETINYQDFGGRTALSWAAQRGQLQTVAELLEHGADPNIVTPTGMAPLHYACGALNPTCISPLLAYGADINAIDHDGHNSLHLATQHRDDVAYLVPLVEAGISIDAKTNYDFTPLIDTVGKDNVASATYLLNHGANVNERGQYGKTPIMYAIEYNSHSCLRLLLARGADHRIECSAGPTIAHIAAYDADIDTLQILIEAQLEPLPLHSLEMEGYGELTIEEIITKRLREKESLDEIFTTTFNQFINSIVGPQDPDNISNSTDRTEEVWEDALEHQSEEVDSV
jgi:ankyrin repeat protein